jgi:hypothetical protein
MLKIFFVSSLSNRLPTFCGRVPASVLARHYSDFSPEALKEIYKRAGISILR